MLVGPPKSGKSSFFHSLSNAHLEVAEYPFSTTMMMPGMVPYEDVLIELVDTPPVTSDYMHGQLLGEMKGDRLEIIPTSAEERDSVNTVPRLPLEWLGIVRVYTKAPGEKPKSKSRIPSLPEKPSALPFDSPGFLRTAPIGKIVEA